MYTLPDPSMVDVVPLLQRLAECIVSTPAGLPHVERDLAALRDAMGTQAFCSAVCAVLVESPLPVVVRQAAGMVMKQQLKTDQSSDHQNLLPQLIKGLAAEQPQEVVNVVSTIAADMCVTHGDALVTALLNAQRSPGTLRTISYILETHQEGGAVLIHSPATFAALCTLIPDILQIIPTAGEHQPLFVTLLKLLFSIPDAPPDANDKVPAGQSSFEIQQRHAPEYMTCLFTQVKDKAVVLSCLSDSIEYWLPCQERSAAAFEQMVTSSFQVALDALASGNATHKATACGFFAEVSAQTVVPPTLLLSHMPKVLPLVIDAMKRTDEDMELEGVSNNNNAHEPEDELTSHLAIGRGEDAEELPEETNKMRGALYERMSGASNLRVEAQFTIQMWASELPDKFTDAMMAHLQSIDMSDKEKWQEREAIATMIAAAAEGCVPFLAQDGAINPIVEMLAKSYIETEPRGLVRNSALYALGELTRNILEACNEMDDDSDEEEPNVHVPPIVTDTCLPVLTARLCDPHKLCQATCISVLQSISETNSTLELAQTMLGAATSGKLQLMNRKLAFRATAIIVKRLPEGASDIHLIETVAGYLHTLLAESGAMLVRRSELPSVLVALEACAGLCTEEAAVSVVGTSLTFCHRIVTAAREAAVNHPDKDLGLDSVSIAMDTVSAFNSRFPAAFAQHAAGAKQLLSDAVTLIDATGTEEASLFRREELIHSCASLIGDLAGSGYGTIADVALELARFLFQHAVSGQIRVHEESGMTAVSNIMWALGEIVDRLPEEQCAVLLANVEPLRNRAVSMVVDKSQYGAVTKEKLLGVMQNAAVLLGRIARRGAVVMQGVETDAEWVDHWCRLVWKLDDDTEEKVNSLAGMLRAALQLGESMVALTIWVCLAGVLASWEEALTPELAGLKATLLAQLAKGKDKMAEIPPQYQIAIVFRTNDQARMQKWSAASLNNLAKHIGDRSLAVSEAQWKGLCKQLQASPSGGLSEQKVVQMYTTVVCYYFFCFA